MIVCWSLVIDGAATSHSTRTPASRCRYWPNTKSAGWINAFFMPPSMPGSSLKRTCQRLWKHYQEWLLQYLQQDLVFSALLSQCGIITIPFCCDACRMWKLDYQLKNTRWDGQSVVLRRVCWLLNFTLLLWCLRHRHKKSAWIQVFYSGPCQTLYIWFELMGFTSVSTRLRVLFIPLNTWCLYMDRTNVILFVCPIPYSRPITHSPDLSFSVFISLFIFQFEENS